MAKDVENKTVEPAKMTKVVKFRTAREVETMLGQLEDTKFQLIAAARRDIMREHGTKDTRAVPDLQEQALARVEAILDLPNDTWAQLKRMAPDRLGKGKKCTDAEATAFADSQLLGTDV
jgi:hypothetical protein